MNAPWLGNKVDEAVDVTRRQRLFLHRIIACWIKRHNDLLGLELCNEFLLEAKGQPIPPPIITLDYI